MIRINLLAAERREAKAVSKGFQAGQKMTVIGSLILVLAAAGIGWRYWALDQQQTAMERDLEAARREEQRLSEILKEVQEFELRRQQLQARVGLIDQLRKGQNAPVHMIDQISRALPDMTWLTSLRQDGYNVTVEGRCLTLTSLSDYVGNLEASRYFTRPVEIVDSRVVTTTGGPDLIQFTIRATFQMADDPTPATGPQGAPVKKGADRG